MNTNNESEKLDRLLNQWSTETSATAEDLSELQERICETLEADSGNPVAPVPKAAATLDASRQTRRMVLAFASGAALTVVLIAAVWMRATPQTDTPIISWTRPKTLDTIPEYAWLNDDRLASKAILFEEMETLFGDRLNWLAENDTHIELGLSLQTRTSEKASQESATSLAIRIVVQKRTAADQPWQVAWASDILSRSEELVELKSESAIGATITLWAYVLPDGMIEVESIFAMSVMNGTQTSLSELQKPGQPREVFTTDIDGIEYRVYQTVAVLNGEVG